MRRLPSWLAENRGALVAAACAAALIAFVHRATPRTFVSAHGLLHSAIAGRFAPGLAAGVPPENPYFAGEPLPYYWFFQYAGAKLAALLGTDPLHAFEILILAGLVTAILGCAALGRRLFRSGAAGLAAAWLLLAGALPQGFLVLGWRLVRWGIPNDDGSYLWGVVHPIARGMRVFDEFSMYGPLFTFFGNVTARPLGIAGLVLVVLALWRFLAEPTSARALVLAGCVALCAAFSSLVALAAAGAIGAGLVVLPAFRARALPAIAALFAGLAASAFTYHHLLGRTPLAFHDLAATGKQVGRLFESGWLLALLAAYGLRASAGPERAFLGLLVLASVVLAIGCEVLALPTGNEDNLGHAALVLLAIPAAGCVRARWGKLACLAFVPTLAIQVGAGLARPPIDLATEHGRIVRADANGKEVRLYRWIEEHTDSRAVFVIDPRPPIRAAGGNSAELPALTGRTLFTERAEHYLVAPNREALARVRIAAQLVDGRPLAPAQRALVSALGRDVYVVRENASDAGALFRADGLAVYRWEP